MPDEFNDKCPKCGEKNLCLRYKSEEEAPVVDIQKINAGGWYVRVYSKVTQIDVENIEVYCETEGCDFKLSRGELREVEWDG